jgi:hypothetical protein
MYKYKLIAVIREPYRTGAVTPAGALPLVTVPQSQHRRSIN